MKSERISTFLQSRIDANDFPSAVYLIAERGEIVFQDALGFAVVEPERIEAQTDTIYDLASLTKPLVIGLLCAKLIERNALDLEQTVESCLLQSSRPEFSGFANSGVRILELLTHISGFPAWKPFYLLAADRAAVFKVIAQTHAENDLQPCVRYSDLNFLILTFLLERIYGGRIDEIAKHEIFTPLNLQNTFYNPPPELHEKTAAGEKGNEYEKRMCVELGYDVSNYKWRDYQIRGEVHDGNCWFMNGASGHAGLFSTAEDVFAIARQFLPETTRLLKPETCRLFRTNFTENFNESRSMAFQLAATKDSTAGAALSKDSFGHLGFTGTSLWIEPDKERIYILLTNRTHARQLPFSNINAARRRFHDLAASELGI